MKSKIFFIVVSLFFLSWASIIRASFFPRARLAGISFKIADFVAPPQPELAMIAQFYQPLSTTFHWSAVSDYQQTQPGVVYELKLDQAVYKTSNNFQTIDLRLSEFGEHYLSLRACDLIGNCSLWTIERLFWLDDKPPLGKLLVDNFEVREAVNQQWLLVGDGDYSQGVWQIGSAESNQQLGENYLSFSLNNQPPLKHLTFEYKQSSSELLPEFDQIGLAVTINGREALLEKRRPDDQWRRAWVNLSQEEAEQLVIQISAGNQGDQSFPSWLEVKNVSTNWVVATDLSQVQLVVSDDYDASPSGNLVEAPGKLSFWFTDHAGNHTDPTELPFLKDQSAPEFINLTFRVQPDGLTANYLDLEATDNFDWWEWQIFDERGSLVELNSIFCAGRHFTNLRTTTGLVQQLKLPPPSSANWWIELRDLSGNIIRRKLHESDG